VANLKPGVDEGPELHVGFVRSNSARGTITSIDADGARAHPGVVAVYTAADLDLLDIDSGVGIQAMDRPILAGDRVRHFGEALAMIVADQPATVADALELVEVDIAPVDPVVDPLTALDREPIHPTAESNLVSIKAIGDPDIGWDHPGVEVDVEVTVRNQRLAPTTLEPLSILALPMAGQPTPAGEGAGSKRGDERIGSEAAGVDKAGDVGVHVYVGHQAPHLLKTQLGRWFDFPVEVTVPDVGGGFGLKARLYPEYVAVVAVCRRLGRPIRWLQTRSEQLATGCHGRDMIHRVRVGGSRSGLIRRVDVDFVLAVGAYPHLGAMVADFCRLVAQELYEIPDFTVTATTVVTNTAPIAPYRGAGRPEAAYAMERAIDAYAGRIGADPITVRTQNMLAPETWPHETATGARYDSGDYRRALNRAVELLDVPAVRAEQDRRAADGNPHDPLLGVGIGAWIERSGGAPGTGEYAKVEATTDGDLVVFTGSTSNGQGHETVWAQVAGRAFAFDPATVPLRISVVGGDTIRVPRGSGSSASRSAQIGASAVWRCARRLQSSLATVAATMLEAGAADVIAVDGGFAVRGVPTTVVDLGSVVEEARGLGLSVTEEEWYVPGDQAFPYGVHGAVVEVDPETGLVGVVRYVAVDDVGVVLHPETVDGQTVGSVAQGIGQALFEQVVYGPDGQLQTGTLLDYTIPGASDLPSDVRTDRIESPAPSNALGVKGAGEGGCIGAPPAVVNAVLDALTPLGVTHLDMPLFPERVWSAINAAAARRDRD
jgi:carbon-monoxide dehydrogenase large subunit